MRTLATARFGLLIAAVALAGCDDRRVQTVTTDTSENVLRSTEDAAQNTLPPRSTVRAEPGSAIDPRSPAAARDLVDRYFSLLGEGREAEARSLWRGQGNLQELHSRIGSLKLIEVDVGQPGPAEGAAGSIFIEVPLALSGQSQDGNTVDLTGSLTLRRANDVPGSTEAQRSWHIFRTDLQPRS